MPRRPREAPGGLVYHVLNRSVRGATVFERALDYEAFEAVLADSAAVRPMRLLRYSVMPNHWHLLLWPVNDEDLSEFMHWLTVTHVQRYHAAHGTSGSGPMYQGRFKSFPVEDDEHLLTVARYVERNPLRALFVRRAEEWPWGSLWHRQRGDAVAATLLSAGPLPEPQGWLEWVNEPQSERELGGIRASVRRGRPFGDPQWQRATAERLGLAATLRRLGRPRLSPHP